MMMVVVVVMVVVWVAITSSSEQWFSFFVSSNGLSYKENSLLDEQNQEESKTHNELCDGELHIYLVFCLNLRQNLNQNRQLKTIILLGALLTLVNNSSVSGMRSRKQAAMNTPPEKHEHRLMKICHLLLDPELEFCWSLERNLNGRTPPRNVTRVITRIVATFSFSSLSPELLSVAKLFGSISIFFCKFLVFW